ncbi:uncharacterized protein LOC121934709 [Sceloporus undulatus]|uniref:uncharacterized protein LOC121934709 n=1 Tax=Sceloporus undulatus TaxID=8520 RepID=UPI001C4CDDEC|nr:uncharacterized protein LOC121934709 [Sceloporus undulatus]
MATSQGSVAPPPSVSGSEPLEDLPTATGVREQDSAKDVCADMATSQGSVAPPPSISGSEPLEDLPTATRNRGRHNANVNHSQRIQTESAEMGTFNPNAPVIFQDLDSEEMEDTYYPSFCSQSTQDECLLFPSDGCPLSSHEMKSHVHGLCKLYLSNPLKAWKAADIVAEKHLDIFIEHVLEGNGTECEIAFLGVLDSPKCNVDKMACLLICQIRGGPCSFPVPAGKESQMKITAIKLLGRMVRYIEQPERLDKWILDFFIIFSIVATNQVMPGASCHTSDWTRKEASDIIKIINRKWKVLNSVFLKYCAFH